MCCCSLEVAFSSSDWSLNNKSVLYSVVARGRCRASLKLLAISCFVCRFFFAGKKVCHFKSVWQIISTAFSKHRKTGFYLIFISILSVPFKQSLSVVCPTSHLNPVERDATAYCPNRELLIVSVSPAVAHCVAFSTNQSVVILHFLCMHERTNAQTHFMSGTLLKNTSKLVKAGLLVLAGVLASLEVV